MDAPSPTAGRGRRARRRSAAGSDAVDRGAGRARRRGAGLAALRAMGDGGAVGAGARPARLARLERASAGAAGPPTWIRTPTRPAASTSTTPTAPSCSSCPASATPPRERIEEYRLAHNGFQNVEELRQVHGVGPALLERLRPSARCGRRMEAAEDEKDVPPPRRPCPQGRAPKTVAAPIVAGRRQEKGREPDRTDRREPGDRRGTATPARHRPCPVGPHRPGARAASRSVPWTNCGACRASGRRRSNGCGRCVVD